VTGWDVFAAQGLPPGMLAELDALRAALPGDHQPQPPLPVRGHPPWRWSRPVLRDQQ
jgi:hypothetical protein